jgi:hypothetical protein
MNRPIAHVVIKTSPPVDPLLNRLRKMGVAQNDNLESFQKLPMGKSLEGRERMKLPFVVIFLKTHTTPPSGHLARDPRTHQLDKTIGQRVLKNFPEGPIKPLFRIR